MATFKMLTHGKGTHMHVHLYAQNVCTPSPLTPSHPHPVPNLLFLGQEVYGADVLISETGDSHLIILLADEVALNDRGKHREAIGRVEGAIVVVGVHSSQLLGGGRGGAGGGREGECGINGFRPENYSD